MRASFGGCLSISRSWRIGPQFSHSPALTHATQRREATAHPDCYKLLHEDNRLRGVRVILMEHHTDHMPALNYLFPRE